MQVEKQEKQRYLRQHIIDSQHDPDDFLDYCETHYNNADIDLWSLKDLEKIVKSFIDSRNNNQHQTSYIDYEVPQNNQEQDKSPSPVKENYQVSQNLIKRKPSKSQNQVTTPFTLVSNPSQNKVKLDPQQKMSLDQIFKDPWKTSASTQSIKSSNDFFNIWAQPANSNPYPSLHAPEKDTKPKIHDFQKQKKQPSKQKPITKQQKVQKPQKLQKKVIPNKDIFDIDFNDISGTKASPVMKISKTPPNPLEINNNQIPKSPKLNSKTLNQGSNFRPGSPKSPSIPSNLKGSMSPTLNQSRKRAKSANKIVQQDWFDIVQCVRAKARQSALKPLQIVITGHQVVNRNVFVPDYVRYFVSTPAINAQVKRKYNHFVKLRTYLQKFYPGFRLPYLSKSVWFQQTDPNNMAIQKFMITHFMNDLLMNRQIRNCRIVEQFLTLKDYKGLKVKFQEYQKMGALHSIEELCLLKGQVNVGYSQDHRIYAQKVPQTVHSIQGALQKYKRLLQQLTNNHLALQKTLTELAQTSTSLQNIIKNLNQSVNIGQCKQLENTMKLINRMYKQMDKQSKFDLQLIQCQLKPIFKYQKQNIGTIKQVLSTKLKFQQACNPNIKSQKKQLYTSQKLQQFKIKINQTSKSVTVLKYQHGYYSNQVVEQFKRTLSNLSDKLSNRFGQFAHDYYQRVNEYSKFWNHLKSTISLPIAE